MTRRGVREMLGIVKEDVMNLIRYEPSTFPLFRQMEEMSERLNRFFGTRPNGKELLTVTDWTPVVDIQETDLERLRAKFPHIDARTGNIYDLSGLPGGYDLVICAEVLEHLEHPERALDQIVSLHPSRVILTVPHEPWFMLSNLAMGKNITRLGNDIEHCNHFTVGSFRRLLSTRFSLTDVTTSYPWILASGQPRVP